MEAREEAPCPAEISGGSRDVRNSYCSRNMGRMVLAPLMPFPTRMARGLTAWAAIPVGLLYSGGLVRHLYRSHRCSRCADCSQADEACCGRESDQGLAHGLVLPVVAVRRLWGRRASAWRRHRGRNLVADEVFVIAARQPDARVARSGTHTLEIGQGSNCGLRQTCDRIPIRRPQPPIELPPLPDSHPPEPMPTPL